MLRGTIAVRSARSTPHRLEFSRSSAELSWGTVTQRNATANSSAVRVSLVILATIFTIAGVYYASSIFAPLTFALLVLALV